MKTSEVLKILDISRPTLYRYREKILLKQYDSLNRWDYGEKSVYNLFNKDILRKVYIYARVSTRKQKKRIRKSNLITKNLAFSKRTINKWYFF